MVTHPVKYTHNQISKATSCYFSSEVKQPGNVDDNFYITSASLKNPALDFDGNAAVLDVAKFLLLQDNDKKLLNYVRKKDGSPLKPFAESDAQLLEWLDGLGNAFLTGELSSHKLAKQIYFPVGSGRYHLLSPLYSSTISQAIFEKVEFSKYSDEMKSARAARKKGSHSFQTVIAFPSLAIQSFGGTKPQNISLMNSVRHGKAYLLSCQPPSWTTQDKPPLGVKTVFSYNYFSKRVWKQVRSLKDFLERYAARTSTITIRDRRSAHIDELVDELIQFAAEIQNMGSSGWSVDSDCKLPLVEQLWLDKGRALVDPDFALEREKADWKADIASCFATWLNKRLKSEKLVLSDVEHNEWQSLLEKKLRLLKDDLEVLS
jgi:CRISPR-associated protein Csy1